MVDHITGDEGATSIIACKLLDREFMQRKTDISNALFKHVEEIEELDDGFGFRFAGFDPWAARIMEFIIAERECCSFFRFELIVEPNRGPVRLRLGGSDEVKAFVLDELGVAAPSHVGRT